jgi:hypothetical protein
MRYGPSGSTARSCLRDDGVGIGPMDMMEVWIGEGHAEQDY